MFTTYVNVISSESKKHARTTRGGGGYWGMGGEVGYREGLGVSSGEINSLSPNLFWFFLLWSSIFYASGKRLGLVSKQVV